MCTIEGSFDLTLKISDRGGGMQSDELASIWRYGYTSTEDHNRSELRGLAGFGFGLPLTRVYAQYFGGDIHVQSMHGYGTDVYLNISHLAAFSGFGRDGWRQGDQLDSAVERSSVYRP